MRAREDKPAGLRAAPARRSAATAGGAAFCLALAAALAAGCGRESSATGAPRATVIGRKGTRSGEFLGPRALGYARDGSIYCIDNTGRMQHLAADGRFLKVWRLPEVERGLPEGLAFDAQGNILVADTHYSRVLRYSPSGELLGQFGSHGELPGQMVYPLGVAVNSRGEIYVSEYGGSAHRVQRFSAAGGYMGGWGSLGTSPGEFSRPSGVAVDPEDRVYVADSVNHRIQRFTPDGRLIDVWGREGSGPGELRYPYDIAITPRGTAVVCEYGNCRVSEFRLDGSFLRSWGGPGRAPGEFATPWCIAAASAGEVAVADTRNDRLQVFHLGLNGGGR